MSNRNLIVFFVVCFLSTAAFNMWRQDRTAQSPPGSEPVLQHPAGSPFDGATASQPAINQPSRWNVQGNVATDGDGSEPNLPPYPDYKEADAARDPENVQVPVIINVEESAATGRRETTIRNLTPRPLDVRVTAINPSSGSRTVVETALPPRLRTNLTDQGLAVVTGSEIVVESPPYIQQSTTVY